MCFEVSILEMYRKRIPSVGNHRIHLWWSIADRSHSCCLQPGMQKQKISKENDKAIREIIQTEGPNAPKLNLEQWVHIQLES